MKKKYINLGIFNIPKHIFLYQNLKIYLDLEVNLENYHLFKFKNSLFLLLYL